MSQSQPSPIAELLSGSGTVLAQTVDALNRINRVLDDPYGEKTLTNYLTCDSARIALRTQQIIANESGAADVIDPLGGSWAIEALTDESLVGLHVAGALKHHFIDRNEVLRRMLPFVAAARSVASALRRKKTSSSRPHCSSSTPIASRRPKRWRACRPPRFSATT